MTYFPGGAGELLPLVQTLPRRKLSREVSEASSGLSSDLQPRPRDRVLVSQLLGYGQGGSEASNCRQPISVWLSFSHPQERYPELSEPSLVLTPGSSRPFRWKLCTNVPGQILSVNVCTIKPTAPSCVLPGNQRHSLL